MSVRIRVISPIVSQGFRSVDAFRKSHWQGIELSHAQIAAGPPSIESRLEEAFATPHTVLEIARAEREGVQAVVIDCLGDPGLGAARERVRIPVVGPGQCAIHLASMLGGRFGVVTALQRLNPLFDDIVHEADQWRRFVGCRAIDTPVLDLHGEPGVLHTLLLRRALELVRIDRADIIVLGCTAMNDAAEELAESLAAEGCQVPVIDPIQAAIHVARALVDCRLTHSKVFYPAAVAREIRGYPTL